MKRLTMILVMITMMFASVMVSNVTVEAKTTKITTTAKKSKTVKTSKKIKKVKTSNKKVATVKKTKSKAFKISAKSVKSTKTAKITVTFTNKSKKTYKVTVKPAKKNNKTTEDNDNKDNDDKTDDSKDNNSTNSNDSNASDNSTSANDTTAQNWTPSRRVRNGFWSPDYPLTIVDGIKTSIGRPGEMLGTGGVQFYYYEPYNTIVFKYEDPDFKQVEWDWNDPSTWVTASTPDDLVTTGFAPDETDSNIIWNYIYENNSWRDTEEARLEATNTKYNEFKNAYNALAKEYGLDLVWE